MIWIIVSSAAALLILIVIAFSCWKIIRNELNDYLCKAMLQIGEEARRAMRKCRDMAELANKLNRAAKLDMENVNEAMRTHGLALCKLIREEHNPYCAIIITESGVKLTREELFVPGHFINKKQK